MTSRYFSFIFKILKNIKNYVVICKIRNAHNPDPEDALDFLNNPKFPKQTRCIDCGFDLEIRVDECDPEFYIIQEVT